MDESKIIETDELNGWSDELEKKVKNWREICYGYNNEHEKIKNYLSKKTNILLILTVILSSLVAMISTIASIKENNFWLIIVSAILSGLSAGISLYNNADQPEHKLIKHSDCAKGYRNLVLLINCQLSLSYKSRTNADVFIKELTSQMLELESGVESIPIITVKETNILSNRSNLEVEEDLSNYEKTKTFELFDKYPTENKNMVNFQLERLNHNV